MLHSPAAVIFDMDGLMLDTERPALDAWITVSKRFGYAVPQEVVFRTVGVNEPAVQAMYMAEYGEGFPYQAILAAVKQLLAEEEAQNGIPHRPGLLTLLDYLSGLSIPLAVATSSAQEWARRKLKSAGIIDRFTAFAFGDEVIAGKPAPDIFLLAAQRLDVEPAWCIGFEDSSAGLESLHRAGIRSVFVKDLFEPPPDIAKTIWRRFTDLAEAVKIFEPDK
jgi:HAD superfamily hydrolase (TIGR01509 family)